MVTRAQSRSLPAEGDDRVEMHPCPSLAYPFHTCVVTLTTPERLRQAQTLAFD